MAQTNFTPIQLYRTSTAAAVPTAGNLAAGELAINLTDERLYFKNAAGVVKLLASNTGALGTVTSVDGSGGTTGLTLTGGPITSSGTLTLGGTLGVANGGTGTGTAFTAGSVVFAGASGVYSQDNANLFWDNSNDRLGIGTASPLVRLHVAGGTGILVSGNGASGFNYAQFSNDVSNGVAIGVGGSTASGWTQNLAAVFNASNNPLAFGTNNLERMRITSAGDVGIGTAAPDVTLHAQSATGQIRVQNTTSGTALIGFRNSSTTDVPWVGTGGDDIRITTQSAERMRILSGGDVGIGTSAPTARLHVNSGASTTAAIIESTGTSSFMGLRNSGVTAFVGSDSTGALLIQTPGSGFSTKVFVGSTGDVGIGTATPNQMLDVRGNIAVGPSGGGSYLVANFNGEILAGVDGSGYYYGVGNGATSNIPITMGDRASFIAFKTSASTAAGSERMRINSAGDVGIGTTTPQRKLGIGGTTNAYMNFNPTSFRQFTVGSDSNGFVIFDDAAAAYRMVVDSSGNVGIGTTIPGSYGKLAVAGAINASTDGSTLLTMRSDANATSLGAYNATGAYLAFQTTPNGGGETERMRISSAGFVGINTTSPSALFHVQAGDVLLKSSSDGSNGIIRIQNTAGTTTVQSYADNNDGWLGTVEAKRMSFITGNTRRMCIDSAGNVGIGTATPTVYTGYTTLELDNATDGGILSIKKAGSVVGYINGASGMLMLAQSNDIKLTTTGSTTIQFSTNATERARIDSSGNLLVGTTSASETSVPGIKLVPADAGADTPKIRIVTSASTSGTAALAIYSTGAAAYRFYVDNAGTIFATSTTISAISDQRLKENVRELDAGLDTILALKPRRFDWKQGKGKDVRDDMGFIAQEVEEVLPELIGDWKAGEGEPDDLKSVKAGDLIPVLVKAIQELTARVAQLEERK
jgi:hypothetical protein